VKQLIGLIYSSALTAVSVALYSAAHQQAQATGTPRGNVSKDQNVRLNHRASWSCWASMEPSLHER